MPGCSLRARKFVKENALVLMLTEPLIDLSSWALEFSSIIRNLLIKIPTTNGILLDDATLGTGV